MGRKQDKGGTAMPLSQTEHSERRQAVANALASQRLEGLEPDAEVIRQLEAFAEGTLAIKAILEAFRGRIVDGRLLPVAGRE
ncbi:antitoxin VbhA family protein [Pseudomonas sp. DTU_2021_1001937_2_SI_NGA_ILE_001]|uniref:antitoxin VbhA family protein n=1 Tax=Pseudomonas sp. DTU_2021_1001937_2_SI_NGA_ILE_001 TaxID=3077589 RepID=UPI0028FC1635|nr:antitoxin VbhA family protein [Pseudomonas sp. DTU_2021_1001937_2_SI_NGA_ILE_001]WNW12256.1 antitoxin VbhA family protein [Pseudomonas sp. DTU_2021_1001937_2_SI_NGA_ILE_001]